MRLIHNLEARLQRHTEAARRFVHEEGPALQSVSLRIAEAMRAGRKLMICGNGGSAADAQHIAAEFTNRFQIERPPLPALALTTDTSAMTSIANDYDFDQIFSKQVRALGCPGDFLLGISTSGNSPNVIRAVETAAALDVRTVALTGGTGGKLAELADHSLCVTATGETAVVQEVHIMALHILCQIIDEHLFPDAV